MSDDGKVQREWRFYLEDMGTFAKKIQTYTQDLTQTEFVANELAYDATLRNLELIGEAATHIPALDNKTPRQCARSKKGRDKVIAVVKNIWKTANCVVPPTRDKNPTIATGCGMN